MKLTPADFVIQKFGGVRATARALKKSPSSVCKWRTRVTKKGIKGSIPNTAQAIILKRAKQLKVNIKAADLIGGRVVKK